jgi:hypothetical protein
LDEIDKVEKETKVHIKKDIRVSRKIEIDDED